MKNKVKKLLAVALCAGALGLSGCGGGHACRQFYVISTSQGYRVALEVYAGPGTVYVSKPFANPLDANALASKLNRDMAEDWEK